MCQNNSAMTVLAVDPGPLIVLLPAHLIDAQSDWDLEYLEDRSTHQPLLHSPWGTAAICECSCHEWMYSVFNCVCVDGACQVQFT